MPDKPELSINYGIFYTYSEGIKKVFIFDGTWIGVTEGSLYEMQIKADGSLQKKTLIFSCSGTIYSSYFTNSYLMISYTDMPSSRKYIVLTKAREEKQDSNIWSGYSQNINISSEIRNFYEWNGFGISEVNWSLIILPIVALIAGLVVKKYRDIPYWKN